MTAIGTLVNPNGIIGLGPDAQAAWNQTKQAGFGCQVVTPSASDYVLSIGSDTTCQSLARWVQTALDTINPTQWPGGAAVLVETAYGSDPAKVVITNDPQTIAQLAGSPPGVVPVARPGLYAVAEGAPSVQLHSTLLTAASLASGKAKTMQAGFGGKALLVVAGVGAVVFMVLSSGKKKRR